MRALRNGLFAALLVFGLGAGAAYAAPFTPHNDSTGSIVEGAMDMSTVDAAVVSEAEIDAADARVSNRELGGSTGLGWPTDENVGLLAKLLMLPTMAGANPMAGAALGLQ